MAAKIEIAEIRRLSLLAAIGNCCLVLLLAPFEKMRAPMGDCCLDDDGRHILQLCSEAP